MFKKCKICGYTKTTLVEKKITSSPYLYGGNEFEMYFSLCNKCGFVWLKNPVKEKELNNYYINSGHMQKRNKSKVYKGQFKFIIDNTVNNNICSVLDVGCGDFDFLRLFDKNIKKIGNDVRKETFEACDDVSYLPGFFKDLKRSKKYDLICFRHIVEHLNDINDTLSQASNIISSQGLIYIEVPSIYYFSNLKFMNTDFTFEHVNYFSTNSLSNLLFKHHFKVIAITQHFDLEGMPYGVIRCLAINHINDKKTIHSYSDNVDHIKSIIKTGQKNMNKLKNNILRNIMSGLSDKKTKKTKKTKKKVAIFGAGGSSIETINYIRKANSNLFNQIELFLDNDKKKIGRYIYGKPIIHPKNLKNFNVTHLVLMSSVEVDLILKQLRRLNKNNYKIITPFI